MKHTIICGFAAALLTSSSFGAALSGTNLLTGGGGALIVTTAAGNPVPQGTGIVALGYFDSLSEAQVAGTNIADAAALSAGFTTIFSDNFSGLGVDGAYFAGGQYTQTTANRALYTFIGNGPDLGSSTEFLLIEHTPRLDGTDSPTSPESDDLFLEDGTLIFGSAGPDVQIDGTNLGLGNPLTQNSLSLEQIPEPSSILLLGICGLGALVRRRRRQD